MQLIKIDKILITENYRKKSGSKESMEELTASIKTKGILQPLLVRPIDEGNKYQIIAGKRRFEAAQLAGLKDVPVIIKNVDDVDALEISVIENTQREDPDLMDEAEGFKRLIKLGKHTAETLSGKIGKSIKYVAIRLKLADLPGNIQKEIQKKMQAGKIGIGHALLITRLKNKSDMMEFLEGIDDQSVSDAEYNIRHFSTRMETAVFDVKQCKDCPSRTKNQTQLFPEIKDTDECMDRSCFKGKVFEHYRIYYKQLEAQGFKVIRDEKELNKLSNKNTLQIESEGWKKPKKYGTMCKKCKEHHAFFFFITKDNYGDKTEIHGEICLNKKCYNQMNKIITEEPETDNDGQSMYSSHTKQIHIDAVRDRFLHTELSAKIKAMPGENWLTIPAVVKRLAIFHIMNKFIQDFDERVEQLLKENCTELKKGLYHAILTIPEKKLMSFFTKTVLLIIPLTDSDILLQAAPEAGLDVPAAFRMDEEYLKTNTKAELLKLAKILKFCGTELDAIATMKKPEMINAILKHDLTGKVTPEIAKSLTVIFEDELMLGDE